MAEQNAFRVVRPVGHLECMSSARHSLGLYFCIANTVTYKISEEQLVTLNNRQLGGGDGAGGGSALLQQFQTAILQVVLTQPVLRVGIIGEDTKSPKFVALPELDLRHVIEEQELDSADYMLRDLENSLQRPWPELARRPGWKIKIFNIRHQRHDDEPPTRRITVSLAIHHSLSDGVGTGLFHEHLLHALNKPDAKAVQRVAALLGEAHDYVVQLPDDIELPPPQEEAIKFKTSLSFVAKAAWDMFAPTTLKGKAKTPAAWTGKLIDLNIKQTHMRSLSLGPDTTTKIVQTCRDHNVTLTPLLNALCAASFARRVPANTAQAVASGTPISLRPFARKDIKFDARMMGVYVTSLQHYYGTETMQKLRQGEEVGADDIWTLAIEVGQRLVEKRASLPNDDMTGLVKYIGDWHAWLKEKTGKPRECLWEVSNVGLVGGGDGDWYMEECLFAQSVMTGAALGVNVAGVRGGGLTLSFTWEDGVLDTELVVGVRDDLEKWMVALGRYGGTIGGDDSNSSRAR